MKENIPKQYILIHGHVIAHKQKLTYELAIQNAERYECLGPHLGTPRPGVASP